MPLAFTKMEGLGNDFLLFDSRRSGQTFTSEQVLALCDRRHGVGADGVLTLLPSERAAARMRIQNADGSDSEMCGNGLRCAVSLLAEGGAGDAFTLETSTGIHRCRVEADGSIWVELVGLTAPTALEVELDGQSLHGQLVSLGNPHFVLLRAANREEASALGSALEHHPRFAPGRTNVEFAERSPGGLRVTVWERGVGLTLACGTGAAAAVAAARAFGWLSGAGPFEVALPGGKVQVDIAPDGRSAGLRGPARKVFVGQIDVG
jgi:diaminopimelate epimerase